MLRFIRRPAVAFVLGAALAASAFVGKTAFGASGDGQIHACYKASNGLLYIVGVSGRSGCQPGDSAVDWNSQGPQGLQGPAGPAGSVGPTGAAGKNGVDGTSIVNTALASGDPNCPYGGTAFTGAGGTTYACNGAPGAKGAKGEPGVFSGEFTAGDSSITVDASGITLQAAGGKVTLDGTGIKIDSALNLLLKSAANATLQASGLTHVQGGTLTQLDGGLLLGNGRLLARVGDHVDLSSVAIAGTYCGCFAVGQGTILP